MHMHPEEWVFTIILVAIVLSFISKMVRMSMYGPGYSERRPSGLRPMGSPGQDVPTRSQWDELAKRLDGLERRMSNIETIVVDANKRSQFDKL